jgi:hypothetical protein
MGARRTETAVFISILAERSDYAELPSFCTCSSGCSKTRLQQIFPMFYLSNRLS